jgi:hypothetical protein
MGFFSFKTQDTDKSIANVHSGYPTFLVCMHDNKGNIWTESAYDGYGEFGNKDFYELLAEMNGLTTREQGIELAYSGKEYLSPNLTESIDWQWSNAIPENCEFQGFFYGDDLEEGFYDDNVDDSWGDWEDVDHEETFDEDPSRDHLLEEERNFIEDERERESDEN